MTRKVVTKGIGQSIQNQKKRESERLRRQAETCSAPQEGHKSSSVLEQTSLDELIDTVELRKESFAAAFGEAEFVEEGPTLVPLVQRGEAEQAASSRRELLSIPRRPAWDEGMSVEELAVLEAEAFVEWRRGLTVAVQEEGLYMTPYERNLDFWRQLWRCLERSDLVVQIVDARDPDFYYCRDLARYVAELDAAKSLLLLVNKADFLSEEQRACWAEHFARHSIDAVFFSALHELQKQERQNTRPAPPAHKTPMAQEKEEAQEDTEEEEEEEEEEADVEKWEAEIAASQASDDHGSPVPRSEFVEKLVQTSYRDAVDLPVPGLDSSDDDLDVGPSPSALLLKTLEGEQGKDQDEQDEQEDVPLGPLGDDDLTVADSQELLEGLASRLAAKGVQQPEGRTETPARARLGTVGFVGYPNVGKSTVINALIGAKRVGMSGRPGKTKHIQTMELPEFGITLCDCPGLVFPSVAASRAHLVVNNTVPIDDLRECFSPVALIIDKVGLARVLEFYGCAGALREARERSGGHELDDSHLFLAALAVSRGHSLRIGVPDENWAARKVLRDFVSGRLLHCEPPPPLPSPDKGDSSAKLAAPESKVTEVTDADEGDFSDLDKFLQEAARKPKAMTKRKMRYLNKQRLKGGLMIGPAGEGIYVNGRATALPAHLTCQNP